MDDREDLEGLVTEARPSIVDYDDRSSQELTELMNLADSEVPAAVGRAAASIGATIDAIVERMRAGGRLIYVGAGTSGRLAELDAEECGSTFSTQPGQVVALVAGAGLDAPARDAAEDNFDGGARAVEEARVSAGDSVVGVSASGRTPFVLGALDAAAKAGALTAAVVSVPGCELARLVEHEIAVVVGPEFLAGSTRLKAGTAQKLVLNTISTIAMIRLGKTYGDLMVDVAGTNEKQRVRARRAVRLATGKPASEADDALEAAGGNAKVAIVSLLAGIDSEAARTRLLAAGGSVREALR
jgi:N-acetylmuramic acid 6-phosphate etherase